jgi:hypothetical protein
VVAMSTTILVPWPLASAIPIPIKSNVFCYMLNHLTLASLAWLLSLARLLAGLLAGFLVGLLARLLAGFLARFLARLLAGFLSRLLAGFLSRLLARLLAGFLAGLLAGFLARFLARLLAGFLARLLSGLLGCGGFLGGGSACGSACGGGSACGSACGGRVRTGCQADWAPLQVGGTLDVLLVPGGAGEGDHCPHGVGAAVPVRGRVGGGRWWVGITTSITDHLQGCIVVV